MNMGTKMTVEQIEDFMKEADPKGEGAIDIEELCQRLCPPKKWNVNKLILVYKSTKIWGFSFFQQN